MKRAGIGLWMYRNQGGDGIEARLKKELEAHDIFVVNDFDLRRCYSENGKIITENGFDLTCVKLLYHMNADEQTPYQIHILEALANTGIRLVNSWQAFSAASDKFIANLLMRNAGVRVPPSAIFSGQTSKEVVKKTISTWKSAIVKPRFSYGGKGILKFDNVSSLIDFIQATKDFYVDFYIEKYIPFTERDYRVEIVGGEYVGSYSRGLLHSFKTNMSAAEKSSDGVFLKNLPDQKQIELATASAHAVGLDATIVDMVKSLEDDEFYVLETNCMLGVFVQAANALIGIRPADPTAYDYASDDIKLKKLAQFLIHLHRNNTNDRT